MDALDALEHAGWQARPREGDAIDERQDALNGFGFITRVPGGRDDDRVAALGRCVLEAVEDLGVGRVSEVAYEETEGMLVIGFPVAGGLGRVPQFAGRAVDLGCGVGTDASRRGEGA